MGLTISDLMRITLTKVAKEKTLPFDMHIPNELTAKTITNSEKGVDVHKTKDADDLFDKLGI
ncbi:antitoxin of YafQ-DinJ toxin-antitoxin system (fragment) [Xenorhabdus bovienii str. Intermedium]|uniref:Antitoxin of YafQ-DinJ toxin-antitoxin system n=2 Tax=Xenorhabdus bovienii TaxID=40576 RepID=A0A077QNF1_XENBV